MPRFETLELKQIRDEAPARILKFFYIALALTKGAAATRRFHEKFITMKYALITFAATAVLFSACKKERGQSAANEGAAEAPPVRLTLKWETDPLLTTCESVLYDDHQKLLYVSNINGAPDAKDGNGFISKVSLDGKVTEPFWVKGLDAPKGMGLANGKLYVADIQRVCEIDAENGNILKSYPAEGAVFLNDIAVDGNKVYISDSRGGAIYLIEDGKISAWMKDLHNPNGLFIDDGTLVMASWDDGTLNTVDLASKEVTVRTDSIENPDGIQAIGNGEFLVSSWNGMVSHIDADWKKTLVLDTRSVSLNAADIEFIPSRNLLLVPTFFKNKVMAYEVSR